MTRRAGRPWHDGRGSAALRELSSLAMVRDAALLLLLLVVAPPHAAGFSSSTDETVAQQLDALAKQLPALAAWAAEAEERLADCCSCTGRTPPEIRGAATAYEGLNKVAVTG